jgi:hypothetical protein
MKTAVCFKMKDFKVLSSDSQNNIQHITKLLNNPFFYNSKCPLFTVTYSQIMWNLTVLFWFIMLTRSMYQPNYILNPARVKCWRYLLKQVPMAQVAIFDSNKNCRICWHMMSVGILSTTMSNNVKKQVGFSCYMWSSYRDFICIIYPWKKRSSDNLKWQLSKVGIRPDTATVNSVFKLTQFMVFDSKQTLQKHFSVL